MGMYRTFQDRIDADGGVDEGCASGYSSGSDKGSCRCEERLKKHLPYLSVDLGLVEWFNKAVHSWGDAHYSIVMNLEDRAPWQLFNRCSFGEEDEAYTDGVEPKCPYRAAGTFPFSCKRFAFALIEKQDEIEECDEKSDPRVSANSPDTAANTLAKLTINENAKQEKLTQPQVSSNKNKKLMILQNADLRRMPEKRGRPKNKPRKKAKADARREDPDTQMENLIRTQISTVN